MLSIVVCTRSPDTATAHRTHVAHTIGCEHEYIPIHNPHGAMGLGEAYNHGVDCAGGEVVVFVHDDVFFIAPGWGVVVEGKFAADPSLGAAGVAGTSYLSRTQPLWCSAGRPFIHGRVVHHERSTDRCLLTVFCSHEHDCEVVAADGLFLAVRRDLFSQVRFDAATFDRFHFYDLDLCMQIRPLARLIVTPDVMVKHFSGGSFGEEWVHYAARFAGKYVRELPASCTNESPGEQREGFDALDCNQILHPRTAAAIRRVGLEPPRGSTM